MSGLRIEDVPADGLVERVAELTSWPEAGPPPRRWVVARSRRTAERLLALATAQKGAPCGGRPMSLSGLAWHLASTVSSGDLLPEWVEPGLVHDALRAEPGPLVRPARRPGGLAWLTAAIRIARGLGPGRFWDGARGDFPQPDTSLEREHLSRLVAAFERHLERHRLLDRVRATSLAGQAPIGGAVERVVLVRAGQLAPLERELLEALGASVSTVWLRPGAASPSRLREGREIGGGESLATACRRTAEDLRGALDGGLRPEDAAVAVFGGRGRRRRAAVLLARFGVPVGQAGPAPDPLLEAVAAVLTGRATREQVVRLLLLDPALLEHGVTPRVASELTQQSGCAGVHPDRWWSRLQGLARAVEREVGPDRDRARAARALSHGAGDLLHRARRLRERLKRRGAALTWTVVGDAIREFAGSLLGSGESGWRAGRAADALSALDRWRVRASVEVAVGLWLDRTRRGSARPGTPLPAIAVPVISGQEVPETGARAVWCIDDRIGAPGGMALPGPLDVPDPPPGSDPANRAVASLRAWGLTLATFVGRGRGPERHPTPANEHPEEMESPWTRPAILARRRRAHQARRDPGSSPGPLAGVIGPPEEIPRLTLEDLSDLAACPFRLLLRRRLGVPEDVPDRSCLDPHPDEVARIRRRVLRDAWAPLRRSDDPPDDDALAERAAWWVRLRVEEARGGGAAGAPALWNGIVDRLEPELARTVRAELSRARRRQAAVVPAPKPRVVELPRGDYRVEVPLRLDRCERDAEGHLLATVWLGPHDLPPPVWSQWLLAAAAWEAGAVAGSSPLSALRFARTGVGRGSATVAVWTRSTSVRLSADMGAVTDGLARRAVTGALLPAPRDAGTCRACPYRRLCTDLEVHFAGRRETDPEVSAHRVLVAELR